MKKPRFDKKSNNNDDDDDDDDDDKITEFVLLAL